MIVLYTDFGVKDHYVGQLKAVIACHAPQTPVIDLFHEAPVYDIQASAYFLPALLACFPVNAIFCCVVDPGVGSNRRACIVQADGYWFVGPDNGLFNVIAQRAQRVRWWDLLWQPVSLSNTFHGRDIFAPAAAALSNGVMLSVREENPDTHLDTDWPSDLAKVIYTDHYGNLISGMRANQIVKKSVVSIAGKKIGWARTFSEVPPGCLFWHVNSNGLLEISANQGHAADILGARPGSEFEIIPAT